MFLGAGSVMHGMDDDVDMRHYGALRKAMPVTFLTFAMGYLAIIGFPRLLRLLVQGQDHRGRVRPERRGRRCCAMLGAGITGFYMTRLMLMTFFSEKRWEEDVHPHESPKVMTVPLIVLAALSVARRPAAARRLDRRLPGAGGRRPRRTENPPIPALAVSRASWSWSSPSASRSPGSSSAGARCRATAPQDVSFVTRAAAPTSTATRSTTSCVMRPGDRLVHGLVVFDHHGRRRRRRRAARVAVGGVGTHPAPRPDRLRPLLRPVPARRRRSSSSLALLAVNLA